MTNLEHTTPSDGGGGRRRPSGRWAAAEARGRSPRHSDWSSMRDRVDLSDVARRLMGEPPGRRGEAGKRLWWRCPFHPDNNPSLCVEPGRDRWRCFGCSVGGDAVALVEKYLRVTFREAVAFIARDAGPGIVAGPNREPKPKADDPGANDRRAAAVELVERSAERLWTPEGRSALEYLRRDRGLSDQTIRLARLGWAPVATPTRFRGITIPWFGRDGLELVKLRQPEGCEPRYAEVYRRRPTIYPGPPLAILPHFDAVAVVEGELDALLLGQALTGLAMVVTAGSASSRPDAETIDDIRLAYRLFLATDADAAGELAASWLRKGMRVRPPEPLKDWTEAYQAEINLRRWWVPHLVADPYDAEERAAIMEHDGGLTRADAEHAAGLVQQAWTFATTDGDRGAAGPRHPDAYPRAYPRADVGP